MTPAYWVLQTAPPGSPRVVRVVFGRDWRPFSTLEDAQRLKAEFEAVSSAGLAYTIVQEVPEPLPMSDLDQQIALVAHRVGVQP